MSKVSSILIALLSCLLVTSGCANLGAVDPLDEPEPVMLPPPDLSDYRLGVGDGVRIAVFGEENLSMGAEVDPTGYINYPLLGNLKAIGKTALELQEYLRTRLSEGYLVDPDVRVIIVHYRPFYIIGQVRRPGVHKYTVGLTVEKAIAVAGGLTRLASTRRIYLLREDRPVESRIRVDLNAYVRPGDTLLVEEGLF